MNGQLLLHLPIKSLKFASINSDPLPPPEYERVSRSRVLKVFVASPSDVIEQRNALAKLIGDIRDILREAGEPILAESLEPQTVDTSTYDAALALANEYEQVRHYECRRRTHARDDYGVFPNESPGSEGTSACNEIRAE